MAFMYVYKLFFIYKNCQNLKVQLVALLQTFDLKHDLHKVFYTKEMCRRLLNVRYPEFLLVLLKKLSI